MLRNQGNGRRKGVSNLYIILCRLLSTGLPRFLQHIQHIFLPWNAFVETQTAKTFILYDRQDIVLIEGVLCTAADKTGMKNQRMQTAALGRQALAAVQCRCVDKEAVAGIQIELLAADHHVDRAFCDDCCLQLVVPVPRHIPFRQIVIITGTRKSGGSMLSLLTKRSVHCHIAG